MLIQPGENSIIYKGRVHRGLTEPSAMASLPSQTSNTGKIHDHTSVSPITVKEPKQKARVWKTVSAIVEGTQTISENVAQRVRVRLSDAPVGSDVCIDGAPNFHRLAVEPTLSRVKDGHLSEASVLNTSGTGITLRHGVKLGHCLLYDKNIIPDPIELPTEYLSSISSLTGNHKEGNNDDFEQYVKVPHYPETRATIINVLKKYREAVAFPGDQLGVTTYAEHNIKLKPNTNPIYINAYKLPHSHRETVQKIVTEMLE